MNAKSLLLTFVCIAGVAGPCPLMAQVPMDEATAKQMLKEQLRRVYVPTVAVQTVLGQLEQDRQELFVAKMNLSDLLARNDPSYPAKLAAFEQKRMEFARDVVRANDERDGLRAALDKEGNLFRSAAERQQWEAKWGHLQIFQMAANAQRRAGEVWNDSSTQMHLHRQYPPPQAPRAGAVRAQLPPAQPPRGSHTGLYDEVARRLRNSLGVAHGSSSRAELMNRIQQTSPFDSFGGVVLGNEPIAPAKVRSASLAYGAVGAHLRVEVEGQDEVFFSDEFSPTELWCAYQFLHPDAERQRLGAREKDFGLVGILKNKIKDEGAWEFSVHPAIANTLLAYHAMRMDMAISLEDPRLPRLPSGWGTYRWYDERAVVSVENGKIWTRPASGPTWTLLRCKLWDNQKELPFDLDPFAEGLYARNESLQAIDRFARLLAIFNWIDRDGLLYAMPDRIQPVRVDQPNKFYQADMAYEGLTIVRDTLGAADPRDRQYKDSPCKVHRFSLEPDRHYIVEVTSNFDAFLRIETSTGRPIILDDDSAGGRDPRILFRPIVRDEYRFIVTTANAKNTGYYTLRIWEGDIGPGQTVFEWFGLLRPDSPRDAVLTMSPSQVLFLKMDARMSYVLQLRSKDFGPLLRVEDVNRKQLASDSGSRDLNARVVFSPPTTGTYRLVVTNSNSSTGFYTMTVERSNEPIKGIER